MASERVPSRAEFDRLSREFLRLADRQAAAQQELAIQFQRIADLQAELDVIRGAWSKIKPKVRKAKPR